jgi:hypothetical protein
MCLILYIRFRSGKRISETMGLDANGSNDRDSVWFYRVIFFDGLKRTTRNMQLVYPFPGRNSNRVSSQFKPDSSVKNRVVMSTSNGILRDRDPRNGEYHDYSLFRYH